MAKQTVLMVAIVLSLCSGMLLLRRYALRFGAPHRSPSSLPLADNEAATILDFMHLGLGESVASIQVVALDTPELYVMYARVDGNGMLLRQLGGPLWIDATNDAYCPYDPTGLSNLLDPVSVHAWQNDVALGTGRRLKRSLADGTEMQYATVHNSADRSVIYVELEVRPDDVPKMVRTLMERGQILPAIGPNAVEKRRWLARGGS